MPNNKFLLLFFYFEDLFQPLFSQVSKKKFKKGCVIVILGVPKKLVRLIKTCLDGTQSKFRIGNYLSSSFPIENGLPYRHYYLILL